MRRIWRTVVAGRYPARRQEALGSSLARESRIVRQKKAIVHTPWKIWRKGTIRAGQVSDQDTCCCS